MKQRRLIGWFAVVSVLVGLKFGSTSAQQCLIRADWPVYTVIRGDTLSAIARRYNSATSTIQQANCLTGTVVRAGQQLRVPPGPEAVGGLPEFPLSSFFVGVTYLPFERGFMIWRSDTGSIWVFSNNSRRVSNYPLSIYGGLSDGLRQIATPPADMSIPRQGFGRVWQNFPVVREQMGYATGGEQGYEMYIQRPLFGLAFAITLRDGRVVQINPDGSWGFIQPAPPSATPDTGSAPHVGTTFLSFENGFMTWSATDGNIRVYIGGQTGEITIFVPTEYGRLPVDTRRTPPAGRLRPEGGFGKVWSNFADIRNRIGWATSTEQGYLSVERGSSFTLPDGRTVTHIGGNTWSVSEIAAPPTPYLPPTITPGPSPTPFPTFPPPTLTPTLVPLPGTTDFRVGATFQPFENGFMVWRSDNGDILIYEHTGHSLSVFPVAIYGALTINPNIPFPEGRGSPAIRPENGFGKVWSNFPHIQTQLGWAYGSEQGYIIDLAVRPPNLPVRFTLPDGGIAMTTDGTTWNVTGQYALPFTATASIPIEATPTYTPSPASTETVGTCPGCLPVF
jgi:LysM repeat protein